MLKAIDDAKLDAKRSQLATVQTDIKRLENTIKNMQALQKDLLEKESDLTWEIWELETGETYEEFEQRRKSREYE